MGRLQDPHAQAQVSMKPHGNSRRQGNLENGQRGAQQDTIEQVKLPEMGHSTGKHHESREQYCSQQHSAADSIPVTQPAGSRAEQPGEKPLKRQGKCYGTVAPAEGLNQARDQDTEGASDRGTAQPHGGGHRHDRPGVVNSSAADLKEDGNRHEEKPGGQDQQAGECHGAATLAGARSIISMAEEVGKHAPEGSQLIFELLDRVDSRKA